MDDRKIENAYLAISNILHGWDLCNRGASTSGGGLSDRDKAVIGFIPVIPEDQCRLGEEQTPIMIDHISKLSCSPERKKLMIEQQRRVRDAFYTRGFPWTEKTKKEDDDGN